MNRKDEALCRAIDLIEIDSPNCDVLEMCYAALREPDASAGRIAELEKELADVKADRDCWAAQCSARVDDAVRLGNERDALKAALQLIKANTNIADWPDDINTAIQGAGE